MKIRCAIIDDEPLALELLKSYALKTPFLDLINTYSSAVEAMEDVRRNSFDAIFLDIQMPELNGIDFAKMIPNKTKIVFTTAFDQYAIDGYKVNARDYLLKPISYKDFLDAAQKLLPKDKEESYNCQSCNPSSSIFVKSESKLIQIELNKITYVEGLKDYIKIHISSEKIPILSLMSMKNMEETLEQENFIRVHKSYIINTKYIEYIERNRIMIENELIPISDTYKKDLFKLIEK